MRAPLLLLLLSVLCSVQLCRAQQDTLLGDDEYYLEMRGRVLLSEGQQHDDEKKGLDSAEVRVTNENGREVIFGYTDEKGRLAFRLPLGRRFSVTVTRKGFVKKTITVDTHVPYDERRVFVFTFNIDIFQKVDGLDVAVLEKPVARVAYKQIDKNFSYDAAYTNKVNAGLQKMYREYYALKRKEQQKADSAAGKAPAPKPAPAKKK